MLKRVTLLTIKASLLPIKLKNQILYETNENITLVDFPFYNRPDNYQAKNWGDKLNHFLVQTISKSTVLPYQGIFSNHKELPVYRVIGSNLKKKLPSNTVVWGHGFISHQDSPQTQPKHIAAVRGPLTRQKYLDAGISCPEIYGDPAILLPLYLSPKITPQYELGVIPQWRDKKLKIIREITENNDAKLIDVFSDIETFIKDILSCKAIISSSLHGLIAAESYGVPSAWVRFSENPLGDYFKYQDYYASFGIKDAMPYLPSDIKTDIKFLGSLCTRKKPMSIADSLLSSCPFRIDNFV